MRAEASNSACPQRGHLSYLQSYLCTICIEGPPRQFDALFDLHQKSMLIFATIVLGHPKLALESFQRLRESSQCVFSSDSSSLIYWNLGLLKPYILPQRHKYLGYPKNRIIFVAERPARRPSMFVALRLYLVLSRPLENMTVY
ncbi:hypothetical protein ALC53_11988 [Atta colombica]|uniref:Uncharacterized protein n=1 Tax=Atta colombica TaxID=520822 RepID=A0A195AZL4_9HYME|nr:hypothetical protein ALC53_11988 [Atta colombica]